MVSKKTPPSRKMPRGIPSTTPMKMPSRALPPSTTPRQPPLVKGTSQPANVGARSPRLKETVLPKKFRSSQPMKMPTRALTPATTPREPPSLKGKSKQANAGTPKLGGELPAFKTTMTAKPRMPAPRMPAPRFMSTGEPSSSKYVQRAPRVSTGTPGTSTFVQRTPGGAHQRKPSAAGVGMGRVLGTLRSKLTAPRKPAK